MNVSVKSALDLDILLHVVHEFAGRLERRNVVGGNLNGFLRQNVPARLRSPGLDYEATEAAQVNIFARLEGLPNGGHKSFDSGLHIVLFHARRVCDSAHNICFGHCGEVSLRCLNFLLSQIEDGKNKVISLETKEVETLAKPNPPHPLTTAINCWYSMNSRDLPWRATRDPYPIWLCEIMMQQTRIDTGMRYWEAFMSRWPDVRALAAATEEEVLKAWQGLGYYNRARNLLKAAREVVNVHGGAFPRSARELRRLPGIGPYTAAAIASICFDEPVAAVDGNVQRVVSRIADIADPIDKPAGRKAIEALAADWVHPTEPGISNQAFMELGALVCTPRNPKCGECPLRDHCLAAERGTLNERPVKAGKIEVKAMELRFMVLTDGEHVAMVQRPGTGIWAGLWTFPENGDRGRAALANGDGLTGGDGVELIEPFEHVLTHRRLTIRVELVVGGRERLEEDWVWVKWGEGADLALPRAMEKIWKVVEKNARERVANLGVNP